MQGGGGGEGDGVIAAAVGQEGGDGDALGGFAQVVAGGDANLMEEVFGVEDRGVGDVDPTAK